MNEYNERIKITLYKYINKLNKFIQKASQNSGSF